MVAGVVAVIPEVDWLAMLCRCWGGGDGVIQDTDNEGLVQAEDPASLSVVVDGFRGWLDERLIKDAGDTLGPVTAPTGGAPGDIRRRDLVQWTKGTGLNIKAGTESASPSAPAKDSNSIALGVLVLRNGMTSITDTDDSTNGYIDGSGRERV